MLDENDSVAGRPLPIRRAAGRPEPLVLGRGFSPGPADQLLPPLQGTSLAHPVNSPAALPPPAIHRRRGWPANPAERDGASIPAERAGGLRGLRPCAVAVGNFDGVHRGHAALVARLREVARAGGLPAIALTFDPHPASVVRPASAPVPLTTLERRIDLLLDLGLDAVAVQAADPRLLALSAESFYRQVLRDGLGSAAIVEGPDFRFGAGRSGDLDALRRFSAADGVRLEVVEPVNFGGEQVSSSRVRRLVAAGDLAAARGLLSAPYRVSGRVVPGARRGTGLGFPTANLAGIGTLVPGSGVYAAEVTTAGRRPDDAGPAHAFAAPRAHPAAVHVGPNATFGETATGVEAHLIGFTGDLYGKILHVDFLIRLRDTWRFATAESLVRQLAADVAAADEAVRRLGSAAGAGSTGS